MKIPGFFLLVLVQIPAIVGAQRISTIIQKREVGAVLKALSSDDMTGRMIATPGITKAANYIAAQFKKIGLSEFKRAKNYRQKFSLLKPTTVTVSGSLGDEVLDSS